MAPCDETVHGFTCEATGLWVVCLDSILTLQREGLGGEGNHALVKALERLSGITLGAPAGDLPRSR